MDKVKEIVTKIIEEKGLELVKFHMNQNKRRSSIRILIDTPNGDITLDQISNITSLINNSDDFNAEFPKDFKLEVSSPGLNYPLKTFKDFHRQLSRTVKVRFNENETMQTLSGTLKSVDEQNILLIGKFGEKVIPLTSVDQGKIEIKFN